MRPSRATLHQVAQAMAFENALAEVAAAMHARGIRPLAVKGPVVARWLYDDPSERAYGDLDLLVDPPQFDAAEAVLTELGFRDMGAGLAVWDRGDAEHHWHRGGDTPVNVDLHRALQLIPAPPARAWALLSAGAQPLDIAGVTIDTPAPAAHLVIVGLHAAQHGVAVPKPLEDLRRALTRVDEAAWQAAARLAAELGAASALRVGLGLVGGEAVADRLGLAADVPRWVRLRSSSVTETSVGFERLLATRGLRARLALIGHKLVPSPAFIRSWRPLARRGPLGLALVYLWRPVWLAASLPRAVFGWLSATLPPARRARLRPLIAGAWWTLRSLRSCRRQLRRGDVQTVRLSDPPVDRPGVEGGVRRVLTAVPASCLERSLVRQRWHAAQGRPRDVVIGVRGPASEFGAHAWLEGDPPEPGGFVELRRCPPPAST